jgi:rare lipoprotein A
MKKLIPILSLAVLSSCTNTTKANFASLSQDTFTQATEMPEVAVVTKSKTIKKVATKKMATTKQEKGIASWYGDYFHGKKTATGELFDMNAMTAAHNSLPLDSYAEITNTQNHKTIIVRINDRGPFVDHRILDLSYFAAKQLGMDEAGTSNVEIKTIAPSLALQKLQKQNQSVYLQVASFNDKKAAQELMANLKKQHLPEPKISSSSNKNATLYKVQLPIKSSRNANDLNDKLAKIGITDTQFVISN